MNKKTVAITREQYMELIDAINSGFTGLRPNPKVSFCLMLEANLGLRIGDIMKLKFENFVQDGNRYRLDMKEEKTKKGRYFTVVPALYEFIKDYVTRNGIADNEPIIDIRERQVQSVLARAADWLNYKNVSTHSFRKFFATEIYQNNNFDLALVQEILQHSSPVVTRRYIGISSKQVEDAINNHLLISWDSKSA